MRFKTIEQIYKDPDTQEILIDLNNYRPPHDKKAAAIILFIGIIYLVTVFYLMWEVEEMKYKIHNQGTELRLMHKQHNDFKIRFGLD